MEGERSRYPLDGTGSEQVLVLMKKKISAPARKRTRNPWSQTRRLLKIPTEVSISQLPWVKVGKQRDFYVGKGILHRRTLHPNVGVHEDTVCSINQLKGQHKPAQWNNCRNNRQAMHVYDMRWVTCSHHWNWNCSLENANDWRLIYWPVPSLNKDKAMNSASTSDC